MHPSVDALFFYIKVVPAKETFFYSRIMRMKRFFLVFLRFMLLPLYVSVKKQMFI